jgi:hypothetical protein
VKKLSEERYRAYCDVRALSGVVDALALSSVSLVLLAL